MTATWAEPCAARQRLPTHGALGGCARRTAAGAEVSLTRDPARWTGARRGGHGRQV